MKKNVILLFIVLIAVVISSCDGFRDAVSPTYDIIFHKNPPDGSKNKVEKLRIKHGKRLPDAEKDIKWTIDNYKFDGWATRDGKKYERAYNDIILYAQWKPVNN